MCKYALLACACQHRVAVLVGICERAPLVGAGGQPQWRSLRRSASLPADLHRIIGHEPLKASAEEITEMLPSLSLRRLEGIRGTDEDATLFNSDAIIQHIAESAMHCTGEQHLTGLLDCQSDVSAECESPKEEVQPEETPAQRLMREHAARDAAAAARIPSPIKQPSPPKAKDFPTLGRPNTMTRLPVSTPGASYLDAVTGTLKGAAGRKAQTSRPSFAQPTESTRLRTQDTLRKDTAVAGPETSPAKSKQRPSLPNTWTNLSPAKKEIGRPATPPSANRTPKQKAVAPREQKSYMSPNKATDNRLAAGSQSSSKQSTPRVKQAGLVIDTKNKGPSVAAVQSASSATDCAITSGSSDDVFGLSSTPATARASMTRPWALSMNPFLPASAQGEGATVPTNLPEVPNTVLTRRTSRSGILAPVLSKLAKVDLLRGQNTPEAQTAAPRGQPKHRKAASDDEKARRGASGHSEAPTRYDPQREYAPGPSSAVTGSFQRQHIPNPFGLNGEDTLPVRTNRPPRYEKPLHAGIGGLKQLSSKQMSKRIGESLGLAQDAAPTRAPSLSGPAAQDPAILYQGLMPTTGYAPPEVDPAILYSGSVKSHTIGYPTTTTSSLNAMAPDFMPSWMTSALPQPGFANFGTPQITGMLIDEAPAMPFGQAPQHAHQPLDDRFFQELMSHNVAAPQPNVPVIGRPPTALQQFNQAMEQQQTLQMPAALPTAESPTESEEAGYSPGPSFPRRTLRAPGAASWNIRAESNRQYEWSGGDGREITFRGWGPDAEFDPNSPVSFATSSDRKRTLLNRPVFMSSDENQENQSPMPPTAPKKMRESLFPPNGDRMPCGATELLVTPKDCMPWLIPDPGHCYNCKEKNAWTGLYGTDPPVHFY